MKETYFFGDLASVVKVVQCEEPLLPSVLLRHHVTIGGLYVHISSGKQAFIEIFIVVLN